MSFLNIRRDADACIDCGRCDKACMMNVPVATADVVTSSECISCNECVNACPGARRPQGDGARRRARRGARRHRRVVALMVGIVGATTLSGSFDWRAAGPRRGRGARAGAPPATAPRRHADQGLHHARGGRREATGIPGDEFAADVRRAAPTELGLPIKDIKDVYGFTPEDVRACVETRLQQ